MNGGKQQNRSGVFNRVCWKRSLSSACGLDIVYVLSMYIAILSEDHKHSK